MKPIIQNAKLVLPVKKGYHALLGYQTVNEDKSVTHTADTTKRLQVYCDWKYSKEGKYSIEGVGCDFYAWLRNMELEDKLNGLIAEFIEHNQKP